MADNENGKTIDWEVVWESLDWDDEARQAEAIRQRLRQRAVQYAKPVKDTAIVGTTHTILAFHLGTESYAVDVMVVRGIRPLSKITRVPGAPPFYIGVVNVRGQVISVLDLRLFFGMSFDDTTPPREVVIVRANHLEIGLLAHHIEGALTIPYTGIESLDDMQYALGVTRDRLVVLDIVQMFEDQRLIIGGAEE